ncbi:hypothetical protein D3C81_1809330 [compost metagenome]
MVRARPNSNFDGKPRKLLKAFGASAANSGGRIGYGSEAPMVDSSASRQAAEIRMMFFMRVRRMLVWQAYVTMPHKQT